jgi:hypothetical protein
MGWWRFTRLAIESLTRPGDGRDGVAVECDRAMEQLARESRIGAALHRASWIVRGAWRSSRARAIAMAAGRLLSPVRMRGWVVAVAGTTTLAMNAIKPTPVGPLSWLLPSLVIAVGLLMVLAAGPLTRAILNRNS